MDGWMTDGLEGFTAGGPGGWVSDGCAIRRSVLLGGVFFFATGEGVSVLRSPFLSNEEPTFSGSVGMERGVVEEWMMRMRTCGLMVWIEELLCYL